MIDNAVLCSGATVKANTVVSPGCILSYDTVRVIVVGEDLILTHILIELIYS